MSVFITELWSVFGVLGEDLDPGNVQHHRNCEVPAAEVHGGVKQVDVTAYGDVDPPSAYVKVTAISHERAVEAWQAVTRHLNPAAWWSTVRTWSRLDPPPTDVRRVRASSNTVWTRMDDEGYYWSAEGWESGVSWAQVLGWGPVEEVIDERKQEDG